MTEDDQHVNGSFAKSSTFKLNFASDFLPSSMGCCLSQVPTFAYILNKYE